MAESKLNVRAPFVSAEQLSVGALAETLATAGATIPGNAGEIWCYVSSNDTIHWHPTGTPTSSFGHKVTANRWFKLTHAQHGAKIVSDDASDATLVVVYMRGSGTPSAGSISDPL